MSCFFTVRWFGRDCSQPPATGRRAHNLFLVAALRCCLKVLDPFDLLTLSLSTHVGTSLGPRGQVRHVKRLIIASLSPSSLQSTREESVLSPHIPPAHHTTLYNKRFGYSMGILHCKKPLGRKSAHPIFVFLTSLRAFRLSPFWLSSSSSSPADVSFRSSSRLEQNTSWE